MLSRSGSMAFWFTQILLIAVLLITKRLPRHSQQGTNILLVAVYELRGGWSDFLGLKRRGV